MLSLLFGFLIAISGLLGILFWDPFWGLVAFACFTHIPPMQISPEYFVPLRIPFLLSIVTLVVYMFSGKYENKFSFRPLDFWLLVIMLFGMVVGAAGAQSQEWAWKFTGDFAKFVIFYLLLINIVNSAIKFKWFINSLMLSAAWLVYKCWDLRGTTGARFENRNGGVVDDANQFAAALILLCPIVINYALTKENDWRLRVGALVGFFGIIMSIVLTGSRAGFLGASVMLVTCFCYFKEARKKLSVVLIIGILATLPFVPDYYYTRMNNLFSSENVVVDASAQSRVNSWKLSFEVWKNKPWFGCGVRNFWFEMGVFEDVDGAGHVSHSLWFEALSEGGVVVFLPFISLICLFFLNIRRAKKKQIINHGLLVCLQCGFIGFLVAATFVNRLFYEPIYWWSALSVVANKLSVDSGGLDYFEG